MKRFLVFILIMIVAVAAFTPCCILDNCQDDLVTKQDAPKKSTAEGTCSPFFACATCHGFATTVNVINLPTPPEHHQRYFETICAYIPSTYAVTPWQPPRLV